MELAALIEWLERTDGWGHELDDKGVIIACKQFETVTHVTYKAVKDNTLTTIRTACAQGKDVDHITRVTGYFSRMSGWNKGKVGEAKDRYHVKVGP